jgi:hypothetical protein
LFLAIAHWWSGVAALKYALPVVALLQLFSIRVAGEISRELKVVRSTSLPGFGGPATEF